MSNTIKKEDANEVTQTALTSCVGLAQDNQIDIQNMDEWGNPIYKSCSVPPRLTPLRDDELHPSQALIRRERQADPSTPAISLNGEIHTSTHFAFQPWPANLPTPPGLPEARRYNLQYGDPISNPHLNPADPRLNTTHNHGDPNDNHNTTHNHDLDPLDDNPPPPSPRDDRPPAHAQPNSFLLPDHQQHAPPHIFEEMSRIMSSTNPIDPTHTATRRANAPTNQSSNNHNGPPHGSHPNSPNLNSTIPQRGNLTNSRKPRAWKLLRRTRAYYWSLRGFDEDAIAVKLEEEGFGPTEPHMVNNFIREHAKHLIKVMEDDNSLYKIKANDRLESVVREAALGYERSLNPALTITTTRGRVQTDRTGHQQELPDQVTTVREHRDGNPQWLDVMLRATKDLRSLHGLDAPKKTDVTSGGEPMKAYIGINLDQV